MWADLFFLMDNIFSLSFCCLPHPAASFSLPLIFSLSPSLISPFLDNDTHGHGTRATWGHSLWGLSFGGRRRRRLPKGQATWSMAPVVFSPPFDETRSTTKPICRFRPLFTVFYSPIPSHSRYALGVRTLLGAPGLATWSKDATRGSWPCYLEQGRY